MVQCLALAVTLLLGVIGGIAQSEENENEGDGQKPCCEVKDEFGNVIGGCGPQFDCCLCVDGQFDCAKCNPETQKCVGKIYRVGGNVVSVKVRCIPKTRP